MDRRDFIGGSAAAAAVLAAGPAIAGYLRDLTGGATTSVIFGALSFLAVLPLLALFERMVQRQQT